MSIASVAMLTFRWPYKFVHALLRIVLQTGKLNLQSDTPVNSVSDRDASGYVTVHTDRGSVRAKRVIHATVRHLPLPTRLHIILRLVHGTNEQNRWAGHLLDEFKDLIVAGRATLAAIKAPEGFIKHTGAQHWDAVVNVRSCIPELPAALCTGQCASVLHYVVMRI